jgi:hypothetical protein
MPSTVVAAAPLTGPGDIRHLLPELDRLVTRMAPLLQEAARLCTQVRGEGCECECVGGRGGGGWLPTGCQLAAFVLMW